MRLVPSLDLQAGRSRLVFWPGAASGQGTPTDRPERIARHFVELGAPLLHLVDLDGAQRGAPANTQAIQRVAREVAVPLQLAGGVDGPDQIELAFACGATRVVVPLWAVAESDETLRECLRAAGDWLAVGLDGRPERLAGAGVRRLVISHWRAEGLEELMATLRGHDVEVQLAGGVTDASLLPRLDAAGVSALIVGESLFNGSIEYAAATALLGSATSPGYRA